MSLMYKGEIVMETERLVGQEVDADVVLICDIICVVCGVNFYSG